MKMKSFAMIALSGLLAASFTYVSPAMADDANTNSNGQSMQSAPSDNGTPSQQGDSSSSSETTNNSNTGSSSNTGSTDEGSPDTATGDDDY